MERPVNESEKRQMLALLDESRGALLKSLEDVTPEAALRAPAPGKWTILDCVEHLAVSEDYLLSQIVGAELIETSAIPPQREALIAERAADRTRRFESPEEGRPIGRFPTLAAAVEHFLASRERTLRFVESNREDLRLKVTTHPLIGPANCQEMLLTMAMHPLRHAQQVEETKAALNQERHLAPKRH
ncbi:MAG: DinB family protein [Terracidiphilus sp.]